MNLRPWLRRYLLVCPFLLVCLPVTTARAVTVFFVTNTNDSGGGSLRQAILDANANPGADVINFNIGSGLQTISPTSTLPDISDPVFIDGRTQPGFSGTPLIEINASNIPSVPNRGVLHITSGNTNVRSLILNHFQDGGISIQTNGGNHIQGCYIGTDATGSTGTGSRGNGISISSPNNIIGGTTPNSRNVIAAIDSHGISIFGLANGNQIQGNYIGINAAGTAGLPVFSGIFVGTSNNIVGGTTPEARNVIGAGDNGGISIQPGGAFGTAGNVVQGNYVGTDASGTVALGFENVGIAIAGSSDDNIIGGTTPGAGNVISGNGWGLAVEGTSVGAEGPPTGNVLQGNLIGVAADRTTPLPNRLQGVRIANAFNTTIGGTAAGAGNVIAFNGPSGQIGVNGLEMLSSTGNSIRGNSIFSNGRLGIDLDGSGVTPNDPGDGDTGSNNLQNFPLITSVTSNAGQTTIAGTLNSTANTTFAIDFYSNAGCDPSGNGEGAKPFSLNSGVTTDASGNGSFNVIVQAALPSGRVLTATATDPSGNTSEFSPCSSTNAMGSVRFDQASLVAIEDIGFIPVTVVRSGGAGSLSVNYTTVDGTAKAGEDYVATSGTLTFAPGETTKTIDVTILNNAPLEGTDESFSVTLTNPTEPDVVDSPSVAVITLRDSIFIPIITLNNISVTEGNTGTTNATFTVSISEMTGKVVTVNYATNGQSAISGIDFQPVSGSLTFNPRTTAITVSVPVIGDTLDEFDETFNLRLINPVNAAPVTAGLGRATILDDDASPALSISDVSVNEGNSGTTTAVFTVRMSVVSAKSIQVTYTTANGSASSGSDYVETTNTLVINAGQLEGTISITVNGDTDNETNETFLVNLTDAFLATILDGQGTATILNDDGTTVPLQLLLDESGPDPIQAAALDSMLLLRDSFPVVNNNSFMNPAPDRNSRIILFVRNLQLGPGELPSSVVVRLVDSNNASYDLPAEDVRPVQGVDFAQLTFRLPSALPNGKCIVEVKAHSQSSNSGTFRISN